MKSLEMKKDVAALLRARNPLLWVVTREEARVERELFEAAAAAGYVSHTWDIAQGIANVEGTPEFEPDAKDPGYTMSLIEKQTQSGQRGAWFMRDLAPWLAGPPGAVSVRQLKNLARMLPRVPPAGSQAVIVISPSAEVPQELADQTTVLEWPLPDREEIAELLDSVIEGLPEEMREKAAPNGSKAAAVDAAVGLTEAEAQACYSKSLVQLKRIDPVAVAKEKKRIVTRERVLEWYDPIPGGLEAVGGLDLFKAWLQSRSAAYGEKARKYGLPAPKGAVLVGPPGTGKSLSAKAIATAWGVPLLKLDLGALKSKFVGDSEQNVRRAFKVIEAIGRCVVWVDEIEKSLAGATQGGSDGGVSADALGVLLNWMQERAGEAFVLATANDVSALPPELLRKGRFDEVWFIDLPNQTERVAILNVSLKQFGREAKPLGLLDVATMTEGFTGSEIAALVPDAMYEAFADKAREITTEDLIKAAASVVPISQKAKEKIKALRDWAKNNARAASSPDVPNNVPTKLGKRVALDLA